jgi:N-methylhydantoinase B/oxoprolinase/acetone carboxylase alpha subunit
MGQPSKRNRRADAGDELVMTRFPLIMLPFSRVAAAAGTGPAQAGDPVKHEIAVTSTAAATVAADRLAAGDATLSPGVALIEPAPAR